VLLGTSRRTAARVVAEMQAAGLVHRNHTYVCEEGARDRAFDVSVYSLGGRSLQYVRGGLETGDDAKRWAAAARTRARQERRARYVALWNAQRTTRGPTFADLWLGGGGLPAVPSGGSDKVAPTPRKTGGHEQWGPPTVEGQREGGRSQPASPAPLQAPWAPEKPQKAGASRGPQGSPGGGDGRGGLRAAVDAARRAFFG
jgi:hypothetical protein